MTQAKTNEMMDAFLAQSHLARIAMVDENRNAPHVVPVWYLWDGESIWISSYSSTRKIGMLERNPNISVLIDVPQGDQPVAAVLMEGQAELIREPRELVERMSTEIYTRYLGEQGVLEPDPQEWIHSPENLLIRLRPVRIRSWK